MLLNNNYLSKLFLLIGVMTVSILIAVGGLQASEIRIDKSLRAALSLTSISTAHQDSYEDVPGIAGEDRSSWSSSINGRYRRATDNWNHEHRLRMQYGEIDGDRNEDEIDQSNIFRYMLSDEVFSFGSMRLRSVFNEFGHPTSMKNVVGLGVYFLDSETYGTLELRTGPRASRGWNPSEDWESLYELIVAYSFQFENGEFLSEVESSMPTDDSDDYQVRWENNLTSELNRWLNINYRFTLYYENEVEEVATRSVATVNFVYNFF